MKKIAIIGQGYVGLPLAVEFAQHFAVLGFDINHECVEELNNGKDRTLEVDLDKLNKGLKLFSCRISSGSNLYCYCSNTN